MKAYRAKGTFRNGKHDQAYTLDIVASDDEDAKHRIYSNFGSRHNTPRRFILIESLENQLQNEKVSRESFEINIEKIKKLELEKANLLKNEEELMILIMDMEKHMEKLVDSVKEK